jgi:hypothetical protein
MPIAGITASQNTSLEVTIQPTLSYTTYSTYWDSRITNKDAVAATIRCEVDVNPPTTIAGSSVAYNDTVSGEDIQKIDGGTWYATATATGKSVSPVVSLYMAPV